MKMLDKVKYDLSMNKLKVLRTVKVIEKNVKIRFCFLTNYNINRLALETKYLLLKLRFLHGE